MTAVGARLRAAVRFWPLALGLALILWPYFSAPGHTLYIRYFEALTLVNPKFVLQNDLAGWSYQFHLGYATLTESSYVSPLILWIWLLREMLGLDLASAVYPASIMAVLFLSFVWYARRVLNISSYVAIGVASLFLCANAYAVAFVHEGYSAMLLQWALLPISIVLTDLATKRDSRLVLLLPLLFIAASMFQYTETAIDWVALAVLRWEQLVTIFRENRWVLGAFIAELSLNLYWVVPLFVNLKMHAMIPVTNETAADIASATRYNSLTYTLLLRSYSSFWTSVYGVRECSFCDFYIGSYYSAAMLTAAVAALVGLVRAKKHRLLAVTIAALILATGYHYQDELLGIPYQILMGLPDFGVFRGAGMFLLVAIFGFSVGIAEFLRLTFGSTRPTWRKPTLVGLVIAAVVFISLPAITGSWLERGRVDASGNVAFPNFPVEIPPAYWKLHAAVDPLVVQDHSVVYLLPDSPYANYRWGAYGNDFLPAAVAEPTIAQLYWPQPNASVQLLLDSLEENQSTTDDAAIMAAMRIGAVVDHADTYQPAVRASLYGVSVWRRGAVSVLRPRLRPIPLLEAARSVVAINSYGPADSIFRVQTGLLTRKVTNADPCSGPAAYAWAGYMAPITAELRVRCALTMTLTLRAYARGSVFVRSGASGNRVTPVLFQQRTLRRGSIGTAVVHLEPGNVLVTEFARQAGDVSLAMVPSLTKVVAAVPIARDLRWRLYQDVRLPRGTRFLSLNQSFDPEWFALNPCRAFHPDPHFVSNGYANGFDASGCGRVFLVSGAVLAQDLGIIGALFAAAFAIWCFVMASKVETVVFRHSKNTSAV